VKGDVPRMRRRNKKNRLEKPRRKNNKNQESKPRKSQCTKERSKRRKRRKSMGLRQMRLLSSIRKKRRMNRRHL
jgi:hypothetical protein